MSTTSAPAIKAIVIMGIFALILLMLTSAGLSRIVQSTQKTRTVVRTARSPFDGDRAYEELRKVLEFGPRISGSEALAGLQGHIEAQLKDAGLEVRRHEFDALTPIGTLPMVNITGVVEGTEPGIIILGNHYETKYFEDFTFVGANDAGSSTAWMLEMARVLGPSRKGRTIWLCFFDGEECFDEWSPTDGLYGSREFVQKLRSDGMLDEVQAMINVDMIGDCLLGIRQDPGAPDWLTRSVWNTARDLGYGQTFQPFALAIEDDHMPFRRAGVSAINIIDFSYGGTTSDHDKHWHTPNDTIDKVCADSLQIVGDVIFHVIPKIEAQLAASSRENK